MDKRETYTVGYSEVAMRYMMRRHAARDAAFLLSYLKPGMSLLDCGCGPGTITVGLAEAVAPGQVIGVDLDAGQIEIARKVAHDRGTKNLAVEAASVYQLPFPDNSFDTVFSHALFEHLAEPVAGLREIRRVLKPGGLAGVASPDWSGVMFAPRDSEVEEAIQVYTQLQIKNGGNPFVGRELGRLFQEAGFSDIRLTATYDCYERVSLISDLLAERIQTSGPDSASMERLCKALKRWAANPATMFGQSFVAAIGRIHK